MKSTKHGAKRIRERIGLKKKAVERLAKQAFERGIPHQDTTGRLRKYLDKLLINGNANQIKIHSRQVWLFKNDLLITTWGLPSHFHKVEDKMKKARKSKENLDKS